MRARLLLRNAADLLLVICAVSACVSCGGAARETSSSSDHKASPPISGYPQACGKRTVSAHPLGDRDLPRQASAAVALAPWKASQRALPSPIRAMFRLLQQVEPPRSVGLLRLGTVRRLQSFRGNDDAFYAALTSRHHVCYVVGPPAVANDCVDRLDKGISMTVSLRGPNCDGSSAAFGLASKGVYSVQLKAEGWKGSATVKHGSFIIVLPAAFKLSSLRAVEIEYRDRRSLRLPLSLPRP